MFPGISDGELDRIVAYEIDSLGSIFFSNLPSTLIDASPFSSSLSFVGNLFRWLFQKS